MRKVFVASLLTISIFLSLASTSNVNIPELATVLSFKSNLPLILIGLVVYRSIIKLRKSSGSFPKMKTASKAVLMSSNLNGITFFFIAL
ncbi:hypothetical protein ASN18_1264 [Candidatus Magnetominusculus xianensis]|uniref:Secreted protein n=1 Tax=Candidatus Magnetominusculus xianensis TaxID=1748249 RepID=A0ABR5SK76_9BACT|nr:hypothetical protein ASN18_1264 [Candidatus Magnetominusculus xianensis]